MAAILKIVKSPYLSEKLSDFVETWYTASDIEPDVEYYTKLIYRICSFNLTQILHKLSWTYMAPKLRKKQTKFCWLAATGNQWGVRNIWRCEIIHDNIIIFQTLH